MRLNRTDGSHARNKIFKVRMKLSETGELPLLKKIRDRFSVRSKDIIVGIGDDAAAVAPKQKNLLLTTDIMAEGIHFDLRLVTPYQIGFKLISVNASDIYAMGGSPRHVLLNIAVEGNIEEGFIESFLDGIEDAMRLYRTVLIGGDLSSSRSGLVVSAVITGYAKKIIRRSSARSGDKIYVTGNLGDSACGLELLRRIGRPLHIEKGEGSDKPLRWSIMHPLLKRHLLPEAVNPGKVRNTATSMMDISDGLFIDLSRLCDESRVGARIYLRKIPLSRQMKEAAAFLGMDPYRLATTGGEDYELLFTALPKSRVSSICIGEITESERVVVGIDSREKEFLASGFQHWH